MTTRHSVYYVTTCTSKVILANSGMYSSATTDGAVYKCPGISAQTARCNREASVLGLRVPRSECPCKLIAHGSDKDHNNDIHVQVYSRPPHSHVKHRTYECSPSENPTPIPLILVLKNNPFSCKTRNFSL